MTTYQPQNGWTKAQILERVKTEFKGKSEGPDPKSDKGTQCLYRGPNGAKCAVGLFIPDNLYSPDFEGRSATSVIIKNKYLADQLPLEPGAMESLQGVHDTSEPSQTLNKLLEWINERVTD